MSALGVSQLTGHGRAQIRAYSTGGQKRGYFDGIGQGHRTGPMSSEYLSAY